MEVTPWGLGQEQRTSVANLNELLISWMIRHMRISLAFPLVSCEKTHEIAICSPSPVVGTWGALQTPTDGHMLTSSQQKNKSCAAW